MSMSLLKHVRHDRPIAFVDCETTGLDLQTARIVELAVVVLDPDCRGFESRVWRIHPEGPIPDGASDIHGIRDDDVAGCLPFRAIAYDVSAWLSCGFLSRFNLIGYDLPLLANEFLRAGTAASALHTVLANATLLDVMAIYHAHAPWRRGVPRSLVRGYHEYVGYGFDHAHSALGDVLGSIALLDELAVRHDLGTDAEAIANVLGESYRTWSRRYPSLERAVRQVQAQVPCANGDRYGTMATVDPAGVKTSANWERPIHGNQEGDRREGSGQDSAQGEGRGRDQDDHQDEAGRDRETDEDEVEGQSRVRDPRRDDCDQGEGRSEIGSQARLR